jgi:hypothetical protein
MTTAEIKPDPARMRHHLVFMNNLSDCFDPDALGEIDLKVALLLAAVVIADYARAHCGEDVRQQLCAIIREDDRRLPEFISWIQDEGQQH